MSATGPVSIPVLDLAPEVDALLPAFHEAFERVARSGQFIGGPEVEAFEQDVAAYLGVPHAVGLNSGTDALVIALRALGVSPGDEVVTTPFTFFATAEAISLVGATPVFADVDEATFNLHPGLAEAAFTDRTKAVIPVHLYGRPADLADLMEVCDARGVGVVEDCAQSFGARFGAGPLAGRMTGTVGAVGAFSFFPSKNLGALGDAGMLTTADDAIAADARMLRAHGGRRKYHNEVLGYNSRLDALQAALLRVKLPRVDAANAARLAAARRYDDLLAGIDGLTPPTLPDEHVVHQYTVRIHGGRRDAVHDALAAEGIQTMVYYPVPVHRLPVYAGAGFGAFPVAERLAGEVLSLPVGPSIAPDDQARVADALRRALG